MTFKGKNIAEFIAILSLLLLFMLGYVVYEHKEDSKQTQAAFVGGLKEIAVAQRESNVIARESQRENNIIAREQLCLLAMPQEKRERELAFESSFCKRLARDR